MKILALDTSNQALSVALLEDGALKAQTCLNIKKNHSITLMPVIDFLVGGIDWTPADLDRIVVAQGPGSYTGLRIAVATAKTLAATLAIDLVGVSSLHSLVAPSLSGLVVPLIDARRNHVYAGFYDNGCAVQPDQYLSFERVLDLVSQETSVTFVGEVANFVSQIAEKLPQAVIRASLPDAYQLGLLGQDLPAVEVTSFTPAYLKRVEAEEKWLENHQETDDNYISRL